MKRVLLTAYVLTLVLALGIVERAAAASPQWNAVISPAGLVQLQRDDKDVASLVPGLFEVDWKSASLNEGNADQTPADGLHHGKIVAPGGTVVDVELRVTQSGDQADFEYRLTPQANIELNSLHVSLDLPARDWAGGEFIADDQRGSLPSGYTDTVLHTSAVKSLTLSNPAGESLQLDFAQATSVLVQDDRQWGQAFSVRIGTQLDDGENWPANQSLAIRFRLTGSGGMAVEEDGPLTIQAGEDWLPLDASLEIEAGSALDFSHVIPRHAPAGKYGRVIVNSQGKFAFADEPDQAVRFYGVNLCFSAHYLTHEIADQLADRLWRLGYNSLRVHHYESELVDRSSSAGIRLKPDKLDQLDYLLAALKRRGIYVTTDLFVSRSVPRSRIYPAEQGDIAMDEYKMAVHVNDRAYDDFKTFASLLLDHVNPYTQLRYADDPMLAWLSLVNEGNPGNFIAQLKGQLHDDWQRAWNRWLVARYKDRQALTTAVGSLPDEQDPAKGNVPLQNVYASSPLTVQFNVFLAQLELDFFERTRRFIREELRCQALLTDINAWTNPVQMQAVRGAFDYVDDHFYVDHPQFLERPWSLPSKCPNTSPIAAGAPGGRHCAFTRLFGKPFTITEFNYSSPGRFRGVGGILTGTLGAIQDWDGIWRFAYAHSRENVAAPGPLNYFDVSADPLNQAAERASLCLFLRGDIQPAEHSVSITTTVNQLLQTPPHSRDKTPPWDGLAWLTRVGWGLHDTTGPPVQRQLTLPMVGGEIDPFATDAGANILTQLRQRDWLGAENQTDLGKNRFQSHNREVMIDAPENILVLDTARTAGGFAPAGKQINAKSATIEIHETDATVWISSLDSLPIIDSRRLLITHLTDLQNTGASYGDRGRKVLLAWGELPHLVQAGRATVSLRLDHAPRARVFGLSTSGKRSGPIETTVDSGTLVIPLSVDNHGQARMLYEVEVVE